jgi:hypothetical protein
MIVVAVVLVVVVLVAVAAWAVYRRGTDETHSVEGYRQTLDTLQGIRSRSPSGSVRVLGDPTGADDRAGAPAAGGFGVGKPSGSPPATEPSALVFEDPSLAGGGGSLQSRANRRTQDRAMSAMNHRPHRLGAPILVAVVVLAVLVAVVVVGARTKPPNHKTTVTTTTHPAGRSTTRTTGAPAGSGRGGSNTTVTTGSGTGDKSSKSDGRKTAVSTTTVPLSFTAVTSTATTATYTPPTASYTVTFTTTTGDCWVNVSSATGSTLLSQTFTPGESKSMTATGKTTVILGAPSAVSITLDHEPVVLPTGYQTPFTITLLPAAT